MSRVELLCPGCQTKLVVEVDAENAKVVNTDHTSILVLTHVGQIPCGCGLTLRVVLGGVQGYALALAPVAKQEQKMILVPGIN